MNYSNHKDKSNEPDFDNGQPKFDCRESLAPLPTSPLDQVQAIMLLNCHPVDVCL